MAWNEPGGGNRDPWSGRGGDQGPPDLDEIVRKMQNKFGGLFGGRRGGGAGKVGGFGFGLLILVALLVWAASGIYIIDPAERGVVLRFGKYVESTLPGPHWHLPYPIETMQKVNVDEVRTMQLGARSPVRGLSRVPGLGKALMLTQDENIVDVELAVQYRVKDAQDFLFKVRDPEATLQQTTESAVREVIGKSKMDFVLTEGRSEIVARIKDLIQEILDRYQAGVQVTSVNLQYAQPPEEVKGAFDDAIKAREDEQRLKNEAEAYSNEVIPKARGAAARQIEEANGYKARVVAQAEGEAARFLALLEEYEKAPEVTRERLYLEAMEEVLTNTSKVMVDVDRGNNLLYLPLDRAMPGGERRFIPPPAMQSGQATSNDQTQAPRSRDDLRQREVR